MKPVKIALCKYAKDYRVSLFACTQLLQNLLNYFVLQIYYFSLNWQADDGKHVDAPYGLKAHKKFCS